MFFHQTLIHFDSSLNRKSDLAMSSSGKWLRKVTQSQPTAKHIRKQNTCNSCSRYAHLIHVPSWQIFLPTTKSQELILPGYSSLTQQDSTWSCINAHSCLLLSRSVLLLVPFRTFQPISASKKRFGISRFRPPCHRRQGVQTLDVSAQKSSFRTWTFLSLNAWNSSTTWKKWVETWNWSSRRRGESCVLRTWWTTRICSGCWGNGSGPNSTHPLTKEATESRKKMMGTRTRTKSPNDDRRERA